MEFKKYINKMMMPCVAIAAVSICVLSCSDNDDNETGFNKPYVIEVEEGMTMPANEFLIVPATSDCDQAVINALNSLERVTNVKAFKLNTRYDYYNEQTVTKTAYYFNYKQYIDHDNPSKGWFKQQCVLTVAGHDRPTVLHTEGYAFEDKRNDLRVIGEPTLVSVLNANCLQVEYRYFGWSLPEGYTNRWNYFNAKQHSADLHDIVSDIKQCGIVGEETKWLATGVSKNGMTTAHYAYYHPNDMDAYVPFCAPFLLSLDDKRPYTFILSKDAFDEDTEKLQMVKDAFVNFFSNKQLQTACAEMLRWYKPSLSSYSDEFLIKYLMCYMFVKYYPKMSYIKFSRWESMIPKAGDLPDKYYRFIMADEYTRYPGETSEMYYRRRDVEKDMTLDSLLWQQPWHITRAEKQKRHFPYYVQACMELGSYGIDLSWIEHLLTPEQKEYINVTMDPSTYGVSYDNGAFTKEFLDGMKQSTCNMMFVYGMQDPWTGGQIPDDKMGVNCHKLFIQNGTHNDFIDMWNQSEKAELFKWLYSLGFDIGE